MTSPDRATILSAHMCRRTRNTDTRPGFCETAAHRRRFFARRACGKLCNEKRMSVRCHLPEILICGVLRFEEQPTRRIAMLRVPRDNQDETAATIRMRLGRG